MPRPESTPEPMDTTPALMETPAPAPEPAPPAEGLSAQTAALAALTQNLAQVSQILLDATAASSIMSVLNLLLGVLRAQLQYTLRLFRLVNQISSDA